MPAVLRVVHPAPTAAVTALAAALAAIIGMQNGGPDAWRIVLTVAAVLGSQIATGALNDWADRERDREVRAEKPIPAGDLPAPAALAIVATGIALQLLASLPLGALPLLLGGAALLSAIAYDLALSRTPLSPLPYLVSFGLVPLWIAAGVGAPLERVLPAVPLAAAFAFAAHLANTLRDWDADAAGGSRAFTQLIGPARSLALALGVALLVGIGVGAGLALAGRLNPVAATLGLAGLVAVGAGVRGPEWLWRGMLVAAVAWTAAWALATG